jgi:hypothetical protein
MPSCRRSSRKVGSYAVRFFVARRSSCGDPKRERTCVRKKRGELTGETNRLKRACAGMPQILENFWYRGTIYEPR